MFESADGVHPVGAAPALNAVPLAAQLLGGFKDRQRHDHVAELARRGPVTINRCWMVATPQPQGES